MDPEMCETVRQLCMMAAYEQSEENLASLVQEIHRLVSVAQADSTGLGKPVFVAWSDQRKATKKMRQSG